MVVPVATLSNHPPPHRVQPVAPASQQFTLQVVEKATSNPLAVRLHVDGQFGEYLAPIDWHLILTPAWFEDYSVDFVHQGVQNCTTIPGEIQINVPVGKVHVEISSWLVSVIR